MKAYSAEFRAEVLAARDAGTTTREVAARFGVSDSWVRRIVQVRRETGQVTAITVRRERIPKWHAWTEWLLAKLDARPDIYLRELKAELEVELGETASMGLLCAACNELERTRKKKRSWRRNKTGPTSPSGAKSGARRKPNSPRNKSSFSMKLGRKRT